MRPKPDAMMLLAMESFSESFPTHPNAAGSARAALDASISLFSDVLESDRLDDLRLLLSELVTNSVRHSGGEKADPVRVRVSVNRSTVHVEVTDVGDGFRSPDGPVGLGHGEGGWGLFLVDQLADQWGVDTGDSTKVWFDLNRRTVGR
jgi:anti-sigma regulatory factor (Ser/Thr protein kinase)